VSPTRTTQMTGRNHGYQIGGGSEGGDYDVRMLLILFRCVTASVSGRPVATRGKAGD